MLGAPKLEVKIQNYFWSLNKGSMWWYNILGDNKRSISHLVRGYPITIRYDLLTDNLFVLKREIPEPIWIVKRIERRKLIDILDEIIEADPSSFGKKEAYFSVLGIYQALHI